MLGSLSLGDIGKYFPSSEQKWKDKSSLFFLKKANQLIIDKGYKINNNGSGRTGNRASRGRPAEFKTKVHGNGNLLIGHTYTKKLGLEPGQEYKIDLKKESKTIYLTPLK